MENIIDAGTADALGALFSKFLQLPQGAILLEPVLSKILKPRVEDIKQEEPIQVQPVEIFIILLPLPAAKLQFPGIVYGSKTFSIMKKIAKDIKAAL